MSSGGEFSFSLSQTFQLDLLLSAGCLDLLQQTLQLSHSLLQLCALQLRILKLRDRTPCLGQQAKEDSVWVSQKTCSLVVNLTDVSLDMTLSGFSFQETTG